MTFGVPVDIICSGPEPIEWYQVILFTGWGIVTIILIYFISKKIEILSSKWRNVFYFISLGFFSLLILSFIWFVFLKDWLLAFFKNFI